MGRRYCEFWDHGRRPEEKERKQKPKNGRLEQEVVTASTVESTVLNRTCYTRNKKESEKKKKRNRNRPFFGFCFFSFSFRFPFYFWCSRFGSNKKWLLQV